MMTKPKHIGKYEILEEIGRGGFAVVYKARDPNLDQVVTIKVLQSVYADRPDVVRRFLDEARKAVRLRHRGIVRIYAVDEDKGIPYIAMEYLPGGTLADRLRSEPLPLDDVITVVEQVAAALDHAHSRGLVHRDVKPANILFDEDDNAVLVDFGLVKSLAESGLTTVGTSLGTPYYMAPEQAEITAEVDERADVYALGVVAYEMLTGHVPFEAETPLTVLHAHVHDIPLDPCALNQALDEGVAAVVLKALKKIPAERHQSAGAFAAALRGEWERLKATQQEEQRQKRVANLLAQGRQAERGRQWDEAIASFESVLEIDDENRSARRGLTRARRAQKRATREQGPSWCTWAMGALAILLLALGLLWYLSRPVLTVESHHDGNLVFRTEEITGTYRNLGTGWHLWSLVQVKSGDYWVQEYFPAEQPDGEWSLDARFGSVGTCDIGEEFKFLLLAVKQGSDAEKYLQSAHIQGRTVPVLPTYQVHVLDPPITLVRGSPTDHWLADFWDNDAFEGTPVATKGITTTYLFQEWWDSPFDEMPETGLTARFVRRIRLPEDGEYCFFWVRRGEINVLIDNQEFASKEEATDWTDVESACAELVAGDHEIRLDYTNLDQPGALEFWYNGPGLSAPQGPSSGDWHAAFFPTTDLDGQPVFVTTLPGPSLGFQLTISDSVPVVSFGAIFTSTLTLTETGYYRFELAVDDGARFYIDGAKVLDEWHYGPATTYAVEKHIEAGDHTLRVEYYESHEDQYATLTWKEVPAPVLPVQRILFASDRDGDYDIYVMDANGANPTKLTHNTDWDSDPAWSPDGQRVVFASNRDGTPFLYVMNCDGSNVASLGVTGYQPRWSPDGSRIAFMEGPEWEWEIYVMDADGANVIQLTDNDVADFTPSWSPDGSQIVFETGRDGNEEIYVMNADGSNPVNVSQNPDWDGSPAWSPDGHFVAFFSNRDGNSEIYIMDRDGGNQRRLTHNEVEDEFPTWSPDGHFLAFEGDNLIYRNDVEGAYLRVPLMGHWASHERPQWSPSCYGYTFENLTDGGDVHDGAIAVAGDYVWTGGDGGLMRWNRDDPDLQRKFTSEDGLAENNVRAILADGGTSLWVGTGGWPFGGSGLSRYQFGEGREHWRIYTASEGVGTGTVFDLYQDHQGRIWAGTTEGALVYDGQRWQGFDEMENDWVYCIYEASDGVFWFGTSGAGLMRYDPSTSSDAAWQRYDPMDLLGSDREGYRHVTDIVEGAPGELWITTNAGVVYHEGETWQAAGGALDTWTHSAVRDTNGDLWFGTNGGLVRLDADGQHTYTIDDGLTGIVYALFLDDAGALWAAGNGLSRYDRENDRWIGYRAHDDQAHNYVSAILQDASGAFWFGHSIFHGEYAWTGGASRYAPGSDDEWQDFGTSDGLSSSGVHVIYQDRDGMIWFGFDREGGGVCRYESDKERWLPCYHADPKGLASDDVDSIVQTRDGALWFGTSGGGLSRFDGERWETFTQADSGLLSDKVHCLAEDGEGALWITTDQGVNRFFYETGKWVALTTGTSDLITDEVLAMDLDDDDGIWFGTAEGLSHYDIATKRWHNVEGTPALSDWVDNCAQAIEVDRYGTVWIGTDKGLYRSTSDGGWLRLTTANGLASNQVLAVFEDTNGTLWIGTPSGVSRLSVDK